MENLKRTFGDRLKHERKKFDMRQEDLANRLGMTTATIRNWEQGRTWPEMPDFIKLCELLECDADYLAGRIEQKTHDLNYLCTLTGLSERTASCILGEPEIAEALNSLDQDELNTFATALNNVVGQIEASISLLDEDGQERQWLLGIQRQNLELSAFRFREVCSDIINSWCDLDCLLSIMRKKEQDYMQKVAKGEAERAKELEKAVNRPHPSDKAIEEMFQHYMKMIDKLEESNNEH